MRSTQQIIMQTCLRCNRVRAKGMIDQSLPSHLAVQNRRWKCPEAVIREPAPVEAKRPWCRRVVLAHNTPLIVGDDASKLKSKSRYGLRFFSVNTRVVAQPTRPLLCLGGSDSKQTSRDRPMICHHEQEEGRRNHVPPNAGIKDIGWRSIFGKS